MNFRFRYDDVVHARGTTSIALCHPNLVGAPIIETCDRTTCLMCTALRDRVSTVARTGREDATHAVKRLPTIGRFGCTKCDQLFAWEMLESIYVNQMSPIANEVNCMACIATGIINHV